MKKTDPIFIAIVNWFNDKRDYYAGVDLYRKYGTNKNLMNIFPAHPNRYQRKLEYELSKVIGVDFTKIDRLKVPVATPSKPQQAKEVKGKTAKTDVPVVPHQLPDVDPANPNQEKTDLANDMPPIIRRILYEFHDLYSKRTRNHEALKKIQGNSSEEASQRRELLKQIDKFSSRMDSLTAARKAWESTGVLPAESDLWAPKYTPDIALSRAQLLAKKKNIQKSLSKDLSLLEFQSKKQGEAPVPMPAGPKRTKIEARIKQKEEDIAQLNKAINDIDKAQ
jgi:hypothetical protein